MGEICVRYGEDCGKHPIIWQDKPFCCNNCKTIYQLLNKNELYSYYEIENQPGIKVEINNFDDNYAFLDKNEVKEKLYKFKEGNMAKVIFFILSIHCASFVWLLENLNTLNKEISSSLVNFVKKEVSVTFNEKKITLRQLVELLASVHYIPHISLEKKDEHDERKGEEKKLLKKIGVADFVFFLLIEKWYQNKTYQALSFERGYKSYFPITLTVLNDEKENLLKLFKVESKLSFNKSPVEKLKYIKALKTKGKNVVIICNELNNAGTLNEANIGISAADDIYHFSPTCDAVLKAKKFKSLNKFIKFTKTSITVVKTNLGISFLYNIIKLYFAVILLSKTKKYRF